ncbi:MAG: alpha/beta fold hydrolase [Elusimicrobia bacterium]|nr:alpha/beta fold hydrolase [Candidatus Obscuribacterium magneticum]
MMRSKPFLFFSLLLTLPGMAFDGKWQPKSVSIKARDGTILRALYQGPEAGNPTVIMLHGLRANKTEWTPMSQTLAEKGWGVLAYDARGHGESSLTKDQKGGANGFMSFGPPGPRSEWNRMIDDVGAVIRYLQKEEKIKRDLIFLMGASLGANACLNFAALSGGIKGVVLLSPGLNYQGITTDKTIGQVQNPLLIVACSQDAYAYQSSQILKEKNPDAVIWSDVKPGHGVQMFDERLITRIFQWMKSQI